MCASCEGRGQQSPEKWVVYKKYFQRTIAISIIIRTFAAAIISYLQFEPS